MVLVFTGDQFLAHRAARRALERLGVARGSVVELASGMTAQDVTDVASQNGLFGSATLLLDFDAAFQGQAGVKPRNEVMKALGGVDPAATVIVIDAEATPARQKAWRALGEHQHLSLPRGDRLAGWVAGELRTAGVDFERDVPSYLADVFGEDAAGIASEVQKLAALDERLGLERVRAVVNREAARNAFDVIERVAAGDAGGAMAIAGRLVDAGEPVPRLFGALVWQFMLVGKAAGLLARERGRRVTAAQAAGELGVAPYAAEKALRLAADLDEDAVAGALRELLGADVKAKAGSDQELMLSSALIRLARRWEGRAAPRS